MAPRRPGGVRDLLLVGDAPVDARLHALRRTVTRSHTLRWSLRGVTDGHLRMLDRAQALLADSVTPGTIATTALFDVPQRIIGRELATARLVIAGLETLEPSSTTARRGGTHG